MDSSFGPIYVLASERSGTNLLRKLLTHHQDVYYGASPAHFLRHLFYREPYYNDLKLDGNFEILVQDALDLAVVHFSPWQVSWTASDIVVGFTREYGLNRNVVLLCHFLLERYAHENGFESYICKDNDIFEFAQTISSVIPNAKFIYLHRDPRDVVLSQYKRNLQSNSLVSICALWRYEQIRCIKFCHSNPNSIFTLSYRELTTNPGCIRFLCDFLDVAYNLESNNSPISHGQSTDWLNLQKPVIQDNNEKYKVEFNRRQIELIEYKTYLQLSYLGYEIAYNLTKPSRLYLLWDFVKGNVSHKVSMKFGNKDSKWFSGRETVLKRLSLNWKNPYF